MPKKNITTDVNPATDTSNITNNNTNISNISITSSDNGTESGDASRSDSRKYTNDSDTNIKNNSNPTSNSNTNGTDNSNNNANTNNINDNTINNDTNHGNSNNSQSIVSPSSLPVTTISSPRLVIETNTSVDCLDDGYHWRKYGQKTVKGSPFPRSYYKCTEKGCSVKKQVEQNGTSIVNTYEGTHTHLAPAMDDNSELVYFHPHLPSFFHSIISLHLISIPMQIKKRRLRRSEGQDSSGPFKRMHKSLDDIPASETKSNASPSGIL
jgi:WRKY DNA -binding domain